MVPVDGEDGQTDVQIFVFEVGLELIPIQCHLETYFSVAKHVLFEDVEALEEALLGGIDFIEEISSQQQEIDMLSLSMGDHFLKGFVRIVEADWVLLFVSEVHIRSHHKSNPAILHDEPLLL